MLFEKLEHVHTIQILDGSAAHDSFFIMLQGVAEQNRCKLLQFFLDPA